MYQQYFGLAEAPFSIAPDPRFLYLSQRHQEALAHINAAVAAIESGEEAINQRTLLMADYVGPTERRRLFERELA